MLFSNDCSKESDYEFDNFLKSVQTPFNDRNVKHINYIKKYIESTDFGKKIKFKGENATKTITYLSIYMQYQYFNPNESIFKIGKLNLFNRHLLIIYNVNR